MVTDAIILAYSTNNYDIYINGRFKYASSVIENCLIY